MALMAKRCAARLLAALLLLAGASRALAAPLRRSGLAGCPSPVPILHRRADIAAVLEAEGMRVGAELGVLHGTFASETLSRWPGATQYVLVDLWAPQENYVDLANAGAEVQDERMRSAVANTKAWESKVHICRNFTTACAMRFPRAHFDYVYVDARHDRKGVLEDLHAWWPRVRPDGLVCGHDFVTQDEGPQQSGQDWTKNFDGSVDETRRAVRGAVEDFARRKRRQIQVTYRETDWPSWCIRR